MVQYCFIRAIILLYSLEIYPKLLLTVNIINYLVGDECE